MSFGQNGSRSGPEGHGPSTDASSGSRGRAFTRFLPVVLGVLSLAALACQAPPDPITIDERRVIVQNATEERWIDVEIWVNDHFRVTAAALEPGGRFTAPLSTFVAGFGQRFEPSRRVTGVEVSAKDAAGRPIRLVWGEGRRR